MIDFRYILIFGLLANLGTRSMIPAFVIFTLAFILTKVRPQWVKPIHMGVCFRTAIVVLLLLPYALVFTPGGGQRSNSGWMMSSFTWRRSGMSALILR